MMTIIIITKIISIYRVLSVIKQCSKHFTCTNSFNPHNNSIRLLLVFYSFYTGVDRGTIINSLR